MEGLVARGVWEPLQAEAWGQTGQTWELKLRTQPSAPAHSTAWLQM